MRQWPIRIALVLHKKDRGILAARRARDSRYAAAWPLKNFFCTSITMTAIRDMKASQFVGHRDESSGTDETEPWSADDSILSFASAVTEEL